MQGLAIDGGGIRPFPYSRNMSVNPVTYDDIQQLSIPHGIGSVWCSILWDLYWDMIDVYGYNADLINGNGGNNKTIQLVMDGMRLQVCSPGFIDGRDAILQADELNFAGANRCLIWKTFARRGLGYSADQGSSESAFDGTSAFDNPPFCSQTDFANFTSSSQTVCAGSTIIFADITEPISNSVVWSFEGGLPVSSIASNVDVTFNTPGTYSAVLTSTTSLGTDTMTQTITVVEAPSLSANIGIASATADNGFIFINMSGGLPPFTTTWMNMPGLNDLTVNFLASGTYEVTITDAAGCSIDTVFIVQRAEGIEEYSQSTFQAFPNPIKEIVTLRFNANQKPENISLFDLSGRKLQQFQMEQASKNEVVFSCADLASGTYIIQVQFRNSNVAYKRIVKQ